MKDKSEAIKVKEEVEEWRNIENRRRKRKKKKKEEEKD